MVDSKGGISTEVVIPYCALCGAEIPKFALDPHVIHGFSIGYGTRLMFRDNIWVCPDCCTRITEKVKPVYTEIVQTIARENNLYKDGEE